LSRINNLFTNTSETFTYDNLDRLTHFPRYKNNGNTRINSQQDYDNYGRITKNVVGTYDYNTPGKRYQNNNIKINNNDNQYLNLNTRNQDVTYYVNKSPKTIEVKHQNGTTLHDRLTFYNNGIDSRSRVDFQMSNRKKYYSADGSAEITQLASGQVEIVLFLGGDAYTAPAVLHKNASNQENLLYLHRDYLGSIVAITNQAGAVVERRHFDAWGQLTHFGIGTGTSTTTLPNGITSFLLIDRGYTGHEHLLSVGLVHMNGRLYDPVLHRFLQPDNYVQDPMNSQNYNRYGYVYNNPLRFTDPSGELVWFVPLIYAAVNVAFDYMRSGGQLSFFDGVLSFMNGFAAGALSGAATASSAFLGSGASQVNKVMPSLTIYQSKEFNFSVSPFVGLGSSGLSTGLNLNFSGQIGDFVYSASAGYGNNSGASSLGESMGSSNYWNAGGFIGINDGHANYGLGYSYNSFSGNMAQGVGSINLQAGDFGFSFINDLLGDGKDRGRTAAVQMSYNINGLKLVAGLSMMTGEENGSVVGGNPNVDKGMYTEGKMKYLRSGAFYGGLVHKGQSYFAGDNSEKRLHSVQDRVHRNWPIIDSPYFPDRGLPSKAYTYTGSYHPNYLYF
jgi:RHS repeat-associated protein